MHARVLFGFVCTFALTTATGPASAAGPRTHARPQPGSWAQRHALKPGFVRGLVAKSVGRKNARFGRQLVQLTQRLNAMKGKMRGCWTKARLALANLAAGAARRPQIQLGRVLRQATAAFERAVQTNQFGGAALALEAAQWRMRRAFDAFQRRIDWAARWLRQACRPAVASRATSKVAGARR